jgi:hypothetical protein
MFHELLSTEKVPSSDWPVELKRQPPSSRNESHLPQPHLQVNVMRDIFKLIDAQGVALLPKQETSRTYDQTTSQLHHQLQNLQLRADSDARLELSQTEAVRQLINERYELENMAAPVENLRRFVMEVSVAARRTSACSPERALSLISTPPPSHNVQRRIVVSKHHQPCEACRWPPPRNKPQNEAQEVRAQVDQLSGRKLSPPPYLS